jgi:hypothetical protein
MSHITIASAAALFCALAVAPPVSGSAAPGCGPALITTDSLLNTGTANDTTYRAPGTNATTATITSGSNKLWQLVTDPFAINSGSGTMAMSYSGRGAMTTAVSLSGLNSAAVNAYPFIVYGGTPGGAPPILGQPPQFPAQLSSMCSLIGDISYSLSGAPAGDIDVLYDLWLVPRSGYKSGFSGALEVGLFPYFNFAFGYAGTYVKTFTETVTVNGAPTSVGFLEYASPAAGKGAGSSVFFYYPGTGIVSGEVRANLLDFMNEAVATAGLDSSWWAVGIELGTELGDSSSQDFTFSLTKLDIEQVMLAPAPTPTPTPTPVPGRATLRITSGSLSFGAQVFGVSGATSKPKTVTISNPKSAAQPATIAALSIGGADPGDFAVEDPDNCKGKALEPGENCAIKVTFTPTRLGARSSTLTVTDSSGYSAKPVDLEGTGVRAALQL